MIREATSLHGNILPWKFVSLVIDVLPQLMIIIVLPRFFFLFYLTSFDHHQKSNFMYTSSFGSSAGLIISVYCISA